MTKAIKKKDQESFPQDSSIVPFFSHGTRITRSNCKFCQLDFRDEAELKFDEIKNYLAFRRWLEEEKNTNISLNAIRNHIISHYKSAEKEEFLREYASEINKWVGRQTDKIGALRTRMAILDKEMVTIAAEGQDLSLEQRRKNAETIKKLAETLLTYQTKVEEYTKGVEPVTIVVNQLRVIITDEMQNVGDARVKKVLVNVLERLQSSVGDMIIDQESN